MGVLDSIRGRGRVDEQAGLRDQLKSANWEAARLEESIRDLESQVIGDEVGWRRTYARLQQDFSRGGLDTLMDMSRAMYMSNPLIQRAVNVNAYYVWAQGVSFEAQEPRLQELVVDPMITDEYNRQELYGHQALILTEVDQRVDGNVFLALFTSQAGDVQVRSMPSGEIREVITDPNDSAKIWFYRRVWNRMTLDTATGRTSSTKEEALYPCVRYQPVSKPQTLGDIPVYWDAPILHQRSGGLKAMSFGVPETYAALDWARAYKDFLQDWHTIVASLARFAWKATTTKTRAQRLKEKLGGRRQQNELEEPPRGGRRPPIAGAMLTMGEDDDVVPIPKNTATTSAEDAKPSRMMVGSAMDLPDTILSGDPQQGNLATAKTLDRPTELAMLSTQRIRAEFHNAVFRYRMNVMVRLGQLPGRKERVDGQTMYVEPSMDPTVNVEFPPILEHDMGDVVKAIVSAATLDGKPDAGVVPRAETAKLLMSAIGVEDVQDALGELDTNERQQVDQAVETLRKLLDREEKVSGN